MGGQTLDVRPTDPADLDRVAVIIHAAVGTAPARGIEDPGLLSVAVDDAQALPIVVGRLQTDGIPVTELALRLGEPRRGVPRPDRPYGRRNDHSDRDDRRR